jgi:hypothetical protein
MCLVKDFCGAVVWLESGLTTGKRGLISSKVYSVLCNLGMCKPLGVTQTKPRGGSSSGVDVLEEHSCGWTSHQLTLAMCFQVTTKINVLVKLLKVVV